MKRANCNARIRRLSSQLSIQVLRGLEVKYATTGFDGVNGGQLGSFYVSMKFLNCPIIFDI